MNKFIQLTLQENTGQAEKRYFNVANIISVYNNWRGTIITTAYGSYCVEEDLDAVLKMIGVEGREK